MCCLAFGALPVQSTAFEECPTEAFLIQDKVSSLYGVQLATGYYQELSPVDWGQSKMNALAFNFHDNYLYAYSYAFGTIVRIGSDLSVEPVWLEGLPNIGFYVGDISVNQNVYYLYRPGSNYGLYRVAMDVNHEDYLVAEKIVSGSTLSLAIFDLAFHPTSGYAYSVDKWGNLWKIDVELGSAEKISNVGEYGVFGAVYFDVTGNLYISRNSDGLIFQINTNWNYPTAALFAYGPASSNNDGARCAMAPIVSAESPTTDFGDAPDTYLTSINNNGARHDIEAGILYLGDVVTGEPNAYAYNGSSVDDNDGVSFVTGLEVGETALIQIDSSASGFLNAWIDWDRDGTFDTDEQIFVDTLLTEGVQVLSYTVPAWAEAGDTWSRFRLSTQSGIPAHGGVSDGEVEDYSVNVTEQNVVVSAYPSASGQATLAFEDNWPLIGDYDMNDLVIHYRLSTYESSENLIRVKIEGSVVAVGAANHNGFAIRIPGLQRDEVEENRMEFYINDALQSTSALELGRDEAILIVAEDIWDYVTPGENCKFYRTENFCGSNIQMQFTITVPLVHGVNSSAVSGFPFDPFIFASAGDPRNYLFGEAPGRKYEIHLQNQSPTEAFQENFLNRGDDDSDPNNNRFFVNENGMPWAINIPYEWQHPVEYMDIKFAYPQFHNHVLSSGGENVDWYIVENSDEDNLFKE